MALTKYNFNSFDVTSAASKALGFNSSANGFATISPGSMTLIKTLTASSSATLSFLNGSDSVVFDSTYPVYLFKFINIHPETDSVTFGFQADTGTNTNYNQTITSTAFRAQHNEAGDTASVDYKTAHDQAQGTSFQDLNQNGQGADNDQCFCGDLFIFNPSSSTFVKHFISRVSNMNEGDLQIDGFVAGYFNTTTALTRVQFKFGSGDIDAGTIKLYGLKDS